MSRTMPATIRKSPGRRIFLALFLLIFIGALATYIASWTGMMAWSSLPLSVFSSLCLAMVGLEWMLWPETSTAAEPRTARIFGAALFLMTASVLAFSLFKFVTE